MKNNCKQCGTDIEKEMTHCSTLCARIELQAMDAKKLPVAEVMEHAAETFKARQAVYGDNYKLAAEALKAFFPNGLELKTAADQERYHIFMLIVVKLSRYANGWNKPHQDSIHDAGIYSFMLEAIDQNQQSTKI